MSELPELNAWVECLSSNASDLDAETWRRFDALASETRREVIKQIHAQVMAAVRTDPARAVPLAKNLIRGSDGLGDLFALAARGQAVAMHANGRSQEALDSYLQALTWYDANSKELEAARVRRSLVDVLQMVGQSDAALEHAVEARGVFEKHQEWSLLAQLECNVGNVYFRLDRYEKAKPHYEAAQRLFKKEGDEFGRAHALYNLGNIETNAHSFERATQCFTDAKRVFGEVGHTVLAADCDYALGYLNIRRGRFAEARRELLRARDGYGMGGKPSGTPLCNLDLCELHLRVDAHYDAVSYGRKAIDAFDSIGMRYESAKARMLVGMAMTELGREKEGVKSLQAAAQEFAAIGNHTLGALATLHRTPLVKDELEARSILPEVKAAVSYLQNSGDELLGQLAQLALAEVLTRAGQTKEARSTLNLLASRQDSSDYEQLGLPNARIEALRSLASMDLEVGSRKDAERHLRAAISWIDATLEYLTKGDARLAFFARRQPAFAELASLLLEENSGSAGIEAVRLIERSRSRNLAQRVQQARSSDAVRAARENVDFILREHWESILDKDNQSPGGPRTVSPSRSNQLRQAQEHLLELDRHSRERLQPGEQSEAELADERPWTDQPLSIGSLHEQDQILYYLTARSQTYAVLLTNCAGTPEVKEIKCLGKIEDQIHRQLARTRYFVEKRELGSRYSPRQSSAARTGLLSSFKRMGDLLLAPLLSLGIGDSVAGGDLVIVPYGLLHSVPFSALMWREAPLIHSFDVSVARSLKPLRSGIQHLLKNRGVLSCGGAAEDLPAIATELRKIGRSNSRTHRILGPDKFVSALEKDVSESILHIPAHGNYEPDHPLFAGLRLGNNLLAAFDVARLQLPPCLVVLSGCETGRQSVPHGEELYGTEQAFFTAGAKGVLGSLWPISDAGGGDYVASFLENYLAGDSARTALSAVQRQAWRSGASLEDWTSLVYAGDPYLRVPVQREDALSSN